MATLIKPFHYVLGPSAARGTSITQQPQQQRTLMQPFQCVLQHHVANPYVSGHIATEPGNNHAAITNRYPTAVSKTNLELYAHMSNRMLHKTAEKPEAQQTKGLHPPQARAASHRLRRPFTREKHNDSSSSFLPKGNTKFLQPYTMRFATQGA